ncbi:hypothetical protein NC797_13235 [Aquibacillus sp. 3ASR75-11]|uniref:Uncharacterized protein n=1 Tax=Terrihalobacillus insolitus TaxID=2950438 RepID=A0A9X3WTL0_9BACI|nr:hypothetical protein [Terrihalobacillus insolitus]MDC3413660.1 hypothetical protein [Terrihalobacillus insolitus]MDC3425465.1 hypothetical protein [Terrihalobacillus insolitus]
MSEKKKKVIHVKDLVIKADHVRIEPPRPLRPLGPYGRPGREPLSEEESSEEIGEESPDEV